MISMLSNESLKKTDGGTDEGRKERHGKIC